MFEKLVTGSDVCFEAIKLGAVENIVMNKTDWQPRDLSNVGVAIFMSQSGPDFWVKACDWLKVDNKFI